MPPPILAELRLTRQPSIIASESLSWMPGLWLSRTRQLRSVGLALSAVMPAASDPLPPAPVMVSPSSTVSGPSPPLKMKTGPSPWPRTTVFSIVPQLIGSLPRIVIAFPLVTIQSSW